MAIVGGMLWVAITIIYLAVDGVKHGEPGFAYGVGIQAVLIPIIIVISTLSQKWIDSGGNKVVVWVWIVIVSISVAVLSVRILRRMIEGVPDTKEKEFLKAKQRNVFSNDVDNWLYAIYCPGYEKNVSKWMDEFKSSIPKNYKEVYPVATETDPTLNKRYKQLIECADSNWNQFAKLLGYKIPKRKDSRSWCVANRRRKVLACYEIMCNEGLIRDTKAVDSIRKQSKSADEAYKNYKPFKYLGIKGYYRIHIKFLEEGYYAYDNPCPVKQRLGW